MKHLKIFENFEGNPKAVETEDGWKVTVSDETYKRFGKRFWQRAENFNDYKDIIFKNQEEAEEYAKEKWKIKKKHNI